jgi:hypothetical protein
VYHAAEFKDYFLNTVGAKRSTYNNYNSYLSRIDGAIGGLDEAISRDGLDAVINWGQTTNTGPFLTYPSHARSVLKRYLQFVVEARTPPDPTEAEIEDAIVDGGDRRRNHLQARAGDAGRRPQTTEHA